MVSLTTIQSAAAAAHYYEKDDYYARDDPEAREMSAFWGKGAEALGWTGVVDPEQFHAALNGHFPDGIEIPPGPGGAHRPAMDVTFSAPKALSILAEIGGDTRLYEAHQRAVDQALSYLEEHAAQARVTRDGETSHERTANLVVARFTHDTSRALDPQTHTHCVILNATQREDGQWRALSNEPIYYHARTAGVIYRAKLAAEVQHLGYDIERTHPDGRFELKGVSQEQIQHFSQRSQIIREAMEERGLEGPKAAERTALMTRESKRDVDRAQLLVQWQDRARAQGLDLSRMMEQARGRTGREPDRKEVTEAAKTALRFSIDHLTERQAVIQQKDLLRYALEHSTGQATLKDVERAMTQAERTGDLIKVGQGRYTTFEALKTEREGIWMVEKGHGAVVPILSREQVSHHIQDRPFTGGQREAVFHILTTSDRVVGVEGKAGTGKTTMLATVREQAEAEGYQVRGLAPSAAAARQLEEHAEIASQTVSSFLAERQEQGRTDHQHEDKTLYIVDEASMLSAKQAHAVLSRVTEHRARMLLIGDRQQLASVEAGKPFAVLVDRGMHSMQMTEIVRQRDVELKAAVERTIQGNLAEAVERLAQQGRITEISDRQKRLEAIAKDYLSLATTEREHTLVITGSRADQHYLNETIREGLRGQAVLIGPEAHAIVLMSRNLTKAQAREVSSYEVRNTVRFNKTYARLAVERNEYGRVVDIDPERNAIMLAMERDGRMVQWHPEKIVAVETYRSEVRSLQAGDTIRWTRNEREYDRVNGETARVLIVNTDVSTAIVGHHGQRQTVDLQKDRHWEHGYASTVHAAQGRTADIAIYHVDTNQQMLTGRESWYVGISRAREDVRIYTDDRAGLTKAVERSQQQQSALEAIDESRWHGASGKGEGHGGNHTTADLGDQELMRDIGLIR